jgi:hypothetical protein
MCSVDFLPDPIYEVYSDITSTQFKQTFGHRRSQPRNLFFGHETPESSIRATCYPVAINSSEIKRLSSFKETARRFYQPFTFEADNFKSLEVSTCIPRTYM